MAERSQRKAKKSGFSGNHQRSWLWGRHAVSETLQSGVWPVLELYATREAFEQSPELLQSKRAERIPLEIVASDRLEQLSRSSEHQGLVARLGAYPYRSLGDFERDLQRCLAMHAGAAGAETVVSGLSPLVVVCDRIQDAYNFGAILRCCDGAGVAGVVIGDRSQAEVTPHVARSSAGAVNHIPIIQTSDLIATARRIQSLGWQLIAADSNARRSVWDSSLSGLTALIIGSEAHGIRPELLEICDQRVCIPMHGKVTSLNAAVAAGIMLYEIRRQQLAISPV